MNLAHIHLLLNHLPTIGFGIGLCLYLAAYFAKSDPLRRAGLVIFFLVAVMAIPTYVSGNAAESTLCPEQKCPDGVSTNAIRAHEDAALLAFSVMEITGFFSWLALWQIRRGLQLAAWNWTAVLLLSLITFGFMALAANEGGEIRHGEIRDESAAETESPAIARRIGAIVAGNTGVDWLWPACEAVHFVGLCLLIGVVLIVDLRVLGLAKSLPFSALYQLLPLGMLGFGLNLLTGMLFFVAAPHQYINNVEFHRKVIFIALAGINVLYFMLFDESWALGDGDNATWKAKLAAASAIFLWLGILYYGHMLPFLGNSF